MTGLDPPPPPRWSTRRPGSGVVASVVVTVVAAVVGVVVATSGGPSTAEPEAPESLRATSSVCAAPVCDWIETTVALAWRAPAGEVETIEVLIDGSVIARVDPGSTGYEVSDLWIDRSYTFGVRAIGADSTSRTTTLQVTTPVPPMEEAQLDGPFRVRETVRKATNLSALEGIDDPRPGADTTSTWSFSASCADDAGACAADWFRWGPLLNDGLRYEGSFRSRPATCSDGHRTPTTTRMRFVVEGARASAGRWLVDAFRGTMEMSFRCPEIGGRSVGVLAIEGRALT